MLSWPLFKVSTGSRGKAFLYSVLSTGGVGAFHSGLKNSDLGPGARFWFFQALGPDLS